MALQRRLGRLGICVLDGGAGGAEKIKAGQGQEVRALCIKQFNDFAFG